MTEEAAFAVADESPATAGRTVLSTLATAVKTLEYAVLGMLVGRLLRTPSSTFGSHALTGLAVGLVFGSVVLWLNHVHAVAAGSAMPAARVAAICVNELLFPVGCAIVIYFVARFADRHSALERLAAGGG